MKIVNKKKFSISILLILIIVIELLALGFSRAEQTKPIVLSILDYENNLETMEITINAFDGGDSGYYITLPEILEGKKVKKYIIEEKTIISTNNSENINEINTQNIENVAVSENIIEDGNNFVENNVDATENNVVAQDVTGSESGEVEKLPTEKVYLTQEELENAQMSVKVVYDSKLVEDIKVYNQQIAKVIDDNTNLYVQGYMPIGTEIVLEEITDIENEIVTSNIPEEFNTKGIYNIKLINNENEYVNKSEEDIYTISISGINEINEYKVMQLVKNSSETTEETKAEELTIQNIEEIKIEEQMLSFESKDLETFVIFEQQIETLSFVEELQSMTLMALDVGSTETEKYDIWDGTVATGFRFGEGTAAKPYLISSGAELAYLAEMVNDGTTYEGTYFQLAGNIDLNGETWTPIGNYTNSFRGIFDGAGYKISNANITISNMPTSVTSYGIFGSIGGGNDETEIRNVEFNNINISITANGTTSWSWNSTEKGYNIGIVTGTMFKNSTVKNVIVKECEIGDTNRVTMRDNAVQVFVGGIAGSVINADTGSSTASTTVAYSIDNCYVNANIDLNVYPRNGTLGNAGQFYTGGIVGSIRSQAKWPTNCLFTGSITTYGFIGPIFGALRTNTNYTSTNNYNTLWNGNDSGNLTMNSYFTGYMVNGTEFVTGVETGNTPNNTTYRLSTSTNNIGYVQGVNKGLYTNNVLDRLDGFNAQAGGDYVYWENKNGDLSLIPAFSASYTEDPANMFNIVVEDSFNTGNYTYDWYIDGALDTTTTGSSKELIADFDTGYDVTVLVSNGRYSSIVDFVVRKWYVDIIVDIDETNDTATAYLEGTALDNNAVQLSDYTYSWTKTDIMGIEEVIEGANTLSLSGLEKGVEYTITATNSREPRGTTQYTFAYGTRSVVFVDYANGNNNNDGRTPQTPVEDLATAYEKLEDNATRNENIIVMMSDYTDSYLDFYSSRTGSEYAKNATITGMYGGIDYDPSWRFGSTNSSYYFRYLTGDLTLMHLTLNGNRGYMYLICQGHSVTFGEDVTMYNYTTASTNQGLLGSRAPGFHLFAGWYQYNYETLPITESEIVIKSGTFGRVVLGGTPGTSNGQGQRTSHDFMGSSKEDSFHVSILVDIQNSTTSTNYDYDINLLTGGSACGNNYSVVTENIKSGSVGRLLGGSIGDSQVIPNNWEYPNNTFLGQTTINVTGGTIAELYGGCLGRNMGVVNDPDATGNTCDSYFYGDVNINISGGNVTGNIYGAGAGGVTGYNENSSDPYKTYGAEFDTNVNINITGGTIDGNIYGGGYGYTEYLNANVTADDGGALYGDSNITVSGSPTINGNIYGAGCGYDYSAKPNIAQMTGNSNIKISGTPIISGEIFGAGAGVSGYEEMAKLTGSSKIEILSDLSTSVYGGGNIAKTTGTSKINITSGTHTAYIYGGGNIGILDGTANVYIDGGIQDRVYGGGNEAQTTATNVYINSGETTEVYGGGNKAGVTTTNVYLQGGTATTIYGGSNESGDISSSNVTTTSGTATTIYGGNNAGGTVTETNVTINGGNIAVAYGGNNAGGTTNTSNVNVQQGTINTIYGGGNEAETTQANVSISGATTTTAYGGGNKAHTETTNVEINEGNVTNIFGGGNEGETTTTSLYITGGEIENGYGGGNKAGVTTTNVYLQGGTVNSQLFGGSNESGVVTNSNITTTSGTAATIFGGNNAGGTVENSNVILNGGTLGDVYGGNNRAGTTTTSLITMEQGTADNIYGGGYLAETGTSSVIIKEGTITNVYGGGNRAEITNATVKIESGTIDNVYGGGNTAAVKSNSNVQITGGTINTNVYGGGNEGIVKADTNVIISDATILGSAYAGGNGQTAVVQGNTTITIEGNAIIGNADLAIAAQNGSVFGSGNAAATGIETQDNLNDNAKATVNIVGGTIYGNVYGGANTSKVFGYGQVNIGFDAVGDETLKKSDIFIRGTVFGGGEANAAGSEEYDFSFESITRDINIYICGSGYTKFNMEGSIFGSGNASSSKGNSYIIIKDYGTIENPGKNISIQRANIVTIDNSSISLSGARDRTNEHSNVEFSLSRIDELKLKNNSTLYMQYGANLLKKFSSLVDDGNNEVLATVTIDEETGDTVRNVNNRIYMLEGNILNIATSQTLRTFGEVDGMTFLGMYTDIRNPSTSTGLYNNIFDNGEEITNMGTFSSYTYVKALHEENHNTKVDGFYSNYNEDGYIKTKYIGVTPEDDVFYMWHLGEKIDVQIVDIELIASKFATMGTVERVLDFSVANTKFQIVGYSAGLEEGISLVNGDQIEPIALNEGEADSVFGLAMKTGKNSWNTNNTTNFYTANGGYYDGKSLYAKDNSNRAPSLIFCFYHSQNLTKEQNLGTVRIRFQVIEPIDDLKDKISYMDVVITLSTALLQYEYYEAAVSPGEEFDLFTSTETIITDKSAFSTYYSLVLTDFSESKYSENYSECKRVVVSRDENNIPRPFKKNTRIVMLDIATNKYYYYIVTRRR